jgi:hypothetical protein
VTWMQRTRVRVLWTLVGIGLTTLGVLSLTTLPAWPIVGVAVATLALAVNTISSRLRHPICLGCGFDLKHEPVGERGSICPTCGTVNERFTDRVASEAVDADDHTA